MNLHNEDLSLRYLVEEDAYTSVKWRNDPRVWELTVNSPNKVISLDDELNWIKMVIKEKNSHRYAILYKNEYVGNVQLTNIINDECYCGIFIGIPELWGKGIGGKALKLIVELAFNELHINKIKIRIRLKNRNSLQAYSKLNFKETHRDQELIYMELNKAM